VGHAYGDAIDDGLARIEAARAGVRTLSAEFTQTRAMGLFVQTVRTEGRLAVARPDRVR
jgi:outer membrane lipoprotein-sorting protein